MASFLDKLLPQLKKSASITPKRVVGIDFGSASIKVVEVEQREQGLTLTSYGELQLGPYAEVDLGRDVSLEQNQKIEAAIDVIRESGITASDGVLALPLSTSFVTVISFTAEPKEDIGPRIRVEARKYIPVPLNDVILDWTELEQLGDTETKVREVLVAAIQNDSLAAMNDVMSSLKMVSQPSEIELFGALRAIERETDEAIAVMDLGAQTSKMYIGASGLLHRIHRVHAGGVHATEKLAQLLQTSFIEAENQKRNYTPQSSQAAEIKKVMITNYERPFQEFRRLLEQYEARIGKPVSRVVMCGGGASFSDLTPFASYIFDREVVAANPFHKVAYPAFMEDTLTDIAPTFSVALGSALRPFAV